MGTHVRGYTMNMHTMKDTLTTGLWLTTATLAAALVISTYATPVELQGDERTWSDTTPRMHDGTDRPYVATAPASQSTLPPCAQEDGEECYWNGYTMGNGKGRSYVRTGGVTYYTDGTTN